MSPFYGGLLIGLMLGGFVGICIMCAFSINRINAENKYIEQLKKVRCYYQDCPTRRRG